MQARMKLTEILAQSNVGNNWINDNWNDTAPTPEFGPVGPGPYEAHLVEKFAFTAGTGTPGIKLVFSILNKGQFEGRKLWYNIWLTAAAKPQALRDFAKLSIHDKSQIELPLPVDKRIRCRLVVSVRTSDSGELFNEVKRFEPIGVDAVEADPFAPLRNEESKP